MRRLLSAAFVLSLGTVAFLALAVPRLSTGIDERAIRVELQAATSGDTLDQRVRAALDEGDVDGAEQYAALAGELGKPLAPSTEDALFEAQGTMATILRNATDFAGAYVTGNADSGAGLAGAVVSDLTVVGDVRDIISEGGKAATGQEYSEFLLALATIGIAAEGAVIATGGSSLVFKAGVSVLKVAKRTGNLTLAFSQRLVRLARAATGPAAPAVVRTGGNGAGLTRTAARAELSATVGAVNTMAGNAGAANAVKLMRFVRTGDDAKNLATFTGRFGRRSRAVVELTGKTALRSFRVGIRGLRLLIAFLWSMVAWLAGLIGLRILRGTVMGVVNLVRGTVFAVALPAR
ncbi:hypothetical protein RDV64_12100 [Acuticoccus sp. MNP-M23]|uniref:hypothetical protein n=1 Tax=Acuticoccus sp. MNP-M23 TaxID=3072793 RepID=UPI002814B102|nr:hypothetical protein [Acuticoccus sp. MNP-M23]WMS40842.1 hypothetical protein RDV64_12100 [Acuticoccus sp. MNP-M23]